MRGLTCTTTQQPYDLTVVDCTGGGRAPWARDVAFVWRDPARAPAPGAVAPQAAAPPQDGGADDGSAEANDA